MVGRVVAAGGWVRRLRPGRRCGHQQGRAEQGETASENIPDLRMTNNPPSGWGTTGRRGAGARTDRQGIAWSIGSSTDPATRKVRHASRTRRRGAAGVAEAGALRGRGTNGRSGGRPNGHTRGRRRSGLVDREDGAADLDPAFVQLLPVRQRFEAAPEKLRLLMGEDRGGEVEQGKTAGRREEFGEFSGEQYDGCPVRPRTTAVVGPPWTTSTYTPFDGGFASFGSPWAGREDNRNPLLPGQDGTICHDAASTNLPHQAVPHDTGIRTQVRHARPTPW